MTVRVPCAKSLVVRDPNLGSYNQAFALEVRHEPWVGRKLPEAPGHNAQPSGPPALGGASIPHPSSSP